MPTTTRLTVVSGIEITGPVGSRRLISQKTGDAVFFDGDKGSSRLKRRDNHVLINIRALEAKVLNLWPKKQPAMEKNSCQLSVHNHQTSTISGISYIQKS